MDNKNLTTVAFILASFLAFVLLFNGVIMQKISSRVIQDLKRSYTPGPYDPGFDPDKVNPNFFRE